MPALDGRPALGVQWQVTDASALQVSRAAERWEGRSKMRAMTMLCVLAGAGLLVGCGGPRTADAAETGLTQGYRFKVEVPGLPSPGVMEAVDGISMDVGYQDRPDAALGGTSSAPTGAKPSTVTFTLAFDPSALPALRDWVKETYDGKDTRKDISVQLLGNDGRATRTFIFLDCFPTRLALVGPDEHGLLHWTLEVRVNRIDMA